MQPGETCRYPGTEFEFSVDESGAATLRLGDFVFTRGAGGSFRIEDFAVDGVVVSFVASSTEGGGWLLTRVGDQFYTPSDESQEPAPVADLPDADTPFVEVGESVAGEVGEAGERDWFAVTLTAGHAYRIDLEGDGGQGVALGAPHLHGVHDEHGNRLTGALRFGDGEGSEGSSIAFSPPSSGVYYISAAGSEDSTGNYRLAVTGDDFANTTQTAGVVEAGGSITGEVSVPGDQDWFRVALKAGQVYRIRLEGAENGEDALTVPTLAGIHDVTGRQLGAEDGVAASGSGAQVAFTPDEDGIYYLSAGGGGAMGPYTLSVEEYVDDHPESTETTAVVQAEALDSSDGDGTGGSTGTGTPSSGGEGEDGSAAGEIGIPGDKDWFAVTLKGGQSYRIRIEGDGDGAGALQAGYIAGVFDAEGNRIGDSAEVSGDGAGAGGTGGTAGDGAGDTDGEMGKDETGAPSVEFTPDADGTYYISTAGRDGATGAYRVSVQEYADDYADSTETHGGLELGLPAGVTRAIPLVPQGVPIPPRPDTDDSANGEIGVSGDRDWFVMELEDGQSYRIDLEGADTDAGTLKDPLIEGVYDADGNLVAEASGDNSGAGRNSRLVFTPEADGFFFLSVSGAAGDTGTYTASLEEYEDDYTDGADTEGKILREQPQTINKMPLTPIGVTGPVTPPPGSEEASGGVADGEIGPADDRDWFAVNLMAGKAYVIEVKGADTEDGTLEDPYLAGLFDPQGIPVADTSDNDGGVGRNSRLVFTPQADGTWFVAAAGSTGETGTYVVVVEEHSGSWADELQSIRDAQVGAVVSGQIEAGGESDWFAVQLKAGQTYRLEAGGEAASQGTLKAPLLEGVYNAQGKRAPDDSDSAAGVSRSGFTPESDGTYYVKVGAGDGGAGSYALTVDEYADDYGEAQDASGALEPGVPVAGEIGIPGDTDWFAVTLKGGQAYRFRLEGEGAGHDALHAPQLGGIYDAGGNRIFPVANNEGAGDGAAGGGDEGSDGDDVVAPNSGVLVFTPDSDGAYYVSAAGLGSATGAYRLLAEEYTDDYGDTQADATALDTSGAIAGEIGAPGDSDWFSATLTGGQAYHIELEGLATAQGTLENPYLDGVYDSQGNRVFPAADSDDADRNPGLLVFTPDADGAYYLLVTAAGNGIGTYRLSVRGDDAGQTADSSTTVELDASAAGEIGTPGDKDWFAVMLESSKSYRVDIQGRDTGEGTLEDPLLEGIFDADGNPVAATSDNNSGVGTNSRAVFTPGVDGAYYVSAAGVDNHTGTYALSVREHSDDYPAHKDTSGSLEAGDTITGEIELPGDKDWFAVTLSAGGSYRIDLKGSDSHNGTLRNPVLEGVFDADGNLIDGTSDHDSGSGANSRAAFTAVSGGTYYVSAAGFENDTGTYSLAVSVDDFTDTTDTAGKVEVGGSATGEIEEHGDRDWFAVTLKAGQTYRIQLQGEGTEPDALDDPYLIGVYDASGAWIAAPGGTGTGAGADAGLFTPDADGVWFVSVAGHASATGKYSLTVEEHTDDSSDDSSGGAQAAGTVPAGALPAIVWSSGGQATEYAPAEGVPGADFADPAGDMFAAEDLMESFLLAIHQDLDLA